MILVLGASGTNGRPVAQRLADAGRPVRAMVRRPESVADLKARGVEVVAGDLDDPASLDAAMSGVDQIFFVAAVDRRYPEWADRVLEAARRAGGPHVVKFSGLGADPESPVEILRQHGQSDAALVGSGLPWTILRPNSFHQNILWSAGTIREQGAFYLPLGQARQSLVDVRDIADIAVKALTATGHEGQIYEITGPESLGGDDVAEALAAAAGRPVRYVPVPLQAALDGLLASGMPEWNARAVAELYGHFATGAASGVTDTVERLLGRPPIPFARFAADHRDAFA